MRVSYTLPGLFVNVTALLASFYVLSYCVPNLFCCDATDPAMKDLGISRLNRKQPSQVLVAYNRLVFSTGIVSTDGIVLPPVVK